jgi:hypothetical protein
MDKLDLTKAYSTYYIAANRPQLAEFEAAAYLMIQGQGSLTATSSLNRQRRFTQAGLWD